jgi:excisionase family DNA binding protein
LRVITSDKELVMDDNLQPIAVRLDTAARLTDTSTDTLRDWIKKGLLPAAKVGRAYRIRVRDLEALVAPDGVRADAL